MSSSLSPNWERRLRSEKATAVSTLPALVSRVIVLIIAYLLSIFVAYSVKGGSLFDLGDIFDVPGHNDNFREVCMGIEIVALTGAVVALKDCLFREATRPFIKFAKFTSFVLFVVQLAILVWFSKVIPETSVAKANASTFSLVFLVKTAFGVSVALECLTAITVHTPSGFKEDGSAI